MKAVFKLNVSCGRMGELTGLFLAEREDVKNLKASGIEVYFGEVLGKHSEIYGKIEDNEILCCSDAPEVVQMIESHKLETGHNPFHYNAYGCAGEPWETKDGNLLDTVRKWAEIQAAKQ